MLTDLARAPGASVAAAAADAGAPDDAAAPDTAAPTAPTATSDASAPTATSDPSAPADCGPAQPEDCCALSEGVVGAGPAERMAGMLKALSDPTRLQLLSYVTAAGCESVALGTATEQLGISQPTVSHHMKRLVEAGLVRREQHGKQALYTAVPEAFAELRTLLDIR